MKYQVVDSSGWIEYFTDGRYAGFFAPIIKNQEALLVPAAVFYEVIKVTRLREGRDKALQADAYLRRGTPVPLGPELAAAAAEFAVSHGLPMADATIAATARAFDATLWTLDNDFRGLPFIKMPK